MLNKLARWSRIKSPWILHLNSGACNACDIEIVAALTPRFDVERFGVLLKATPRRARRRREPRRRRSRRGRAWNRRPGRRRQMQPTDCEPEGSWKTARETSMSEKASPHTTVSGQECGRAEMVAIVEANCSLTQASVTGTWSMCRLRTWKCIQHPWVLVHCNVCCERTCC